MTEPELQYGSVNFFVCLLNSFEQVPVPGVTENRYLAYAERWGWLCEARNLVGMERTGTFPRSGTYRYVPNFFETPSFRGAFFGKIMDSTEHAATSGSLRTDQGGMSH